MDGTDEQVYELLQRLAPVALLVGSGVSIDPPTSLPSGQVFLDSIIRLIAPDSSTEGRLRSLMSGVRESPPRLRFEGLLETIADLCDPALDILEFLRIPRSPNRNHHLIARLMGHAIPVLTTNFDTGIEAAASLNGIAFDRCVTNSDFEHRAHTLDASTGAVRPLLLKLHGCATDPRSLRATLRQIGRAGYSLEREPSKRRLLGSLFSHHSLIVIGYSGLDDFDVMPMLRSMAQRVLWIAHRSEGPVQIMAVACLPELDGSVAAESQSLYLVQGPSWSVLSSMASYFQVPVFEPLDSDSDMGGGSVDDFLRVWADTHGVRDIYMRRVLCATLFARAEETAWAAEVLSPWPANQPCRRLLTGARENLLGGIAITQRRYEAARMHFEAAANVFGDIGDLQDYGNNLTNMGEVYRRAGEYDLARKFLVNGMRAKRHSHSRRAIATAAVGLANVMRHLGRQRKWLYYLSVAKRAAAAEGELALEALVESLLAAAALGEGADVAMAEAVLARSYEALSRFGPSLSRGASEMLQASMQRRHINDERLAAIHLRKFEPMEEFPGAVTLPSLDAADVDRVRRAITHYNRAGKLYEKANDLRDWYDARRFSALAYEAIEEWQGFKESLLSCMKAAVALNEAAKKAEVLVTLTRAIDPPWFKEMFSAGFEEDLTATLLTMFGSVSPAEACAASDRAARLSFAEGFYGASLKVFPKSRTNAIMFVKCARSIYHDTGEIVSEAHATARLGRIHAESDDPNRAIRCYRRALGILTQYQPAAAGEIERAIEVCKLLRRKQPRCE